MKFLKLIIQYYLPISLALTFTISEKKEVVTDGGFDRMYGFPTSYITNNCGCTHCYEVFISNLLLNILFYGLIIHLLFLILKRFGIIVKTNKISLIIGVLSLCFLIFCFYVVSFESNYFWFEDTEYKIVNSHLEFQFLNIGSR